MTGIVRYIKNMEIGLDGSKSYIDAGNSADFNSAVFTVEVMFKPSTGALSAYYPQIFSKWTNNSDFFLEIIPDNRLRFKMNRYQQDNVIGTTYLQAGQKYHAVVSCDNNSLYLYVNSILEGTDPLNEPRIVNNSNLEIGRSSYDKSLYFEGSIYLFAYYAAYWDAGAVAERYANLSSEIIPDNCKVMYKPPVINNPMVDLSGSGHDGTLYNIKSSLPRVRKIKNKGEQGAFVYKPAGYYQDGEQYRRISL